ncbi:MAG TPA: TetR family transcriptional regulator [Nocardioidaceae bacterium]
MTARAGRSDAAGPQPRTGRGRRAGGADTRGEILAAARASFADAGYAGTSIRGVAAAAGVDPALVHHYFGSKDDLFLESLAMPTDPRVVMTRVAEGDRDSVGPRLVEAFLDVWDDPDTRLPLLAIVKSGVAGEPGRTIVETAMRRLVFGYLVRALGLEDGDRRLGLVMSQMAGLVMTRYVLLIEPMASMPREEVVAWVGPTVQRYLVEETP